MELTLDQALQKGIEAHKAGQVQEADRLYTAILKAQPKHPDANHNMGVLAVGVGKVQEALPFFKTALEANPNTAQFWLSYIDALIKLGRLPDAKAVLDQAKGNGAEGDRFDKLEQRLDEATEIPMAAVEETPDAQREQLNILNTLKLDPAIKLARKKVKEGSVEEAKSIYQDILRKFPENKRARNGIKALSSEIIGKASRDQDLFQNKLQSIIKLYSQGLLTQVLEQVEVLLQQFPKSVDLLNIQGAARRGLGQFEEAIEAYNKALIIKPGYAEAHNNMGNALQERGTPEEAIKAYVKALNIRPEYPEALYNMGNALQEQGRLEGAIEAYNKALVIRPEYSEAYHNLGNALLKQSKLEGAIEAYKSALSINPDNANCCVNLNRLEVQLSKPDIAFISVNSNTNSTLGDILSRNPTYQIQKTISNFMLGRLDLSRECLQKYRTSSETKIFHVLPPKDQVFCSSYFEFLSFLIQNNANSHDADHPKIYHIGESHCLSYAHSKVYIKTKPHVVVPKITFGAKAFHFSTKSKNSYKAITENHLNKIPNGSTVFISIGEIDCRPDVGIIQASNKTGKALNKITSNTVDGYIEWFLNQNKINQHMYYLFNIPAPMYDQQYSEGVNNKVAEVVALFNASLLKKASSSKIKIIDVYCHTTDERGFSNGLYHCDKVHLDNRIIPLIEDGLNA